MSALSVASIMSVVIFLIVAYSSYRNGLFSTLVTLFIIVFSAALAVAFFVPVSRMLVFTGLRWYVQPVSFMVIFVLGFLVMQTAANYLYPPRLDMPRSAHVAGGAILGLLNAYFLTGFLMTAFCLFPGTGRQGNKVIFVNRAIGADVFFANSMKWLSRRTGSVQFPADDFLAVARKEKCRDSVRTRSDMDINVENSECFIRLERLGRALRKYVQENDGAYPETLDDLYSYLPKRKSEKQREAMLKCPATGFFYVLFRPDDYASIKDDKDYVLIYDAAPGKYGKPYGHLGRGKGKRPALFADGRARWVDWDELEGLIQAQKNVLEKAE